MKVRFLAVPAVMVGALIAALHSSEDRRYTPYRDPVGIWTVCAGITGADVVPGQTYTDHECDVLEVRYVDQMLRNMGACVDSEFEFHEVKAWGHFAYNVGTDRFCSSTAANLLRRGRNSEACQQITRWRFVTLPSGERFDCSTPGNTRCPGVWTRRQWERDVCEGRS